MEGKWNEGCYPNLLQLSGYIWGSPNGSLAVGNTTSWDKKTGPGREGPASQVVLANVSDDWCGPTLLPWVWAANSIQSLWCPVQSSVHVVTSSHSKKNQLRLQVPILTHLPSLIITQFFLFCFNHWREEEKEQRVQYTTGMALSWNTTKLAAQ